MPFICYRAKSFNAEHQGLIDKANEICEEYANQGFKLTLRQLYYQFVARDLIPNNMQSYKRLGGVINDARLAGEIDWDSIEDRTRNLERLAHWESPRDILQGAAQQFRFDRWEDQPTRVEVWIEKEALVGVIEPICNQLRVPYFACRGYTSQSEAWGAGQRFQEYTKAGQDVVVLHLGDHDPSGIDMTRDNDDRLAMFVDLDQFSKDGTQSVEVKRLALNANQVKQYKPPPNPAKLTDSRAEGYIAKFGKSSWELDALEPKVIAALISVNVERYIDSVAWEEAIAKENEARRRIQAMADKWKD